MIFAVVHVQQPQHNSKGIYMSTKQDGDEWEYKGYDVIKVAMSA